MISLSKSLSFALVCTLATSAFAAETTPAADTQAVGPAQARLTQQLWGAGIVSAAALVTGFALKNNTLLGLGIGTATGTVAGYISQDVHWAPTWIGEIVLRKAAIAGLAFPASAAQLQAANVRRLELQQQVGPGLVLPAVTAERAGAVKAVFPAWISSWTAYLWYNNLAKKAQAEALAQ